jgi:hypothetical protein
MSYDPRGAFEWKRCLFMIALIGSVYGLHHITKPTPEELKAREVAQVEQKQRTAKACDAALQAKKDLLAKGEKTAAAAVDTEKVCKPEAAVTFALGMLGGGFLAMGGLVLLIGFAINSLTRGGR